MSAYILRVYRIILVLAVANMHCTKGIWGMQELLLHPAVAGFALGGFALGLCNKDTCSKDSGESPDGLPGLVATP